MRNYVEMLEAQHYNEPSPDSELPDDLCPKCGGHGTPQTRPDRDGNWDPCDACEGTGLVDFERGRPHA
jgi:DnaJ-class molecular chaperone